MVIAVIKRWMGRAKAVGMVHAICTGLKVGDGLVARGVEDDWVMRVVGWGVERAWERLGRGPAGGRG